MSEYAINLLSAIENGEESEMSNAFKDALSAKIVDAIDAKKVEVAQGIYGYSNQVDDVASDEHSDDEVEYETTDTSDENGTEEV